MGQKSAAIEQEIRDKREMISRRVDGVEERGGDDIQEVKSRVQKLTRDSPVGKAAEKQPLLTVAGAVGVGVLLGMASGKVHLPGRSDKRQGHNGARSDERNSGAAKPGLLTGLVTALEMAAVAEGRELVHEYLSPKGHTGNGRTNGRIYTKEWEADEPPPPSALPNPPLPEGGSN